MIIGCISSLCFVRKIKDETKFKNYKHCHKRMRYLNNYGISGFELLVFYCDG